MDRTLIALLSHSQAFESLLTTDEILENHEMLGSLSEITSKSLITPILTCDSPQNFTNATQKPFNKNLNKEASKEISDADLINALLKLRNQGTTNMRSTILKGKS